MQQGLLTPAQLSLALRHQQETRQDARPGAGGPELVAEEDVTRARAQQMDLPYVRMQDLTVDQGVAGPDRAVVARKYLLLPVGKTPDGTLKIIVAAWNAHLMDVATKIGARHRLRIAPAPGDRVARPRRHRPVLRPDADGQPPAGALAASCRQQRRGAAPPRDVPPLTPDSRRRPRRTRAPNKRASDVFSGTLRAARRVRRGGNRPDEIDEVGVDQPVVIQFVNRILADAIGRGASDIHFEPRRDSPGHPLPHRRHAAARGQRPRASSRPPAPRASRSWPR